MSSLCLGLKKDNEPFLSTFDMSQYTQEWHLKLLVMKYIHAVFRKTLENEFDP